MMRKRIATFLSLLMLSMPLTAFAAPTEAETILGGMQDQIIEATNDLLGGIVGTTITAADIDLSQAYKIYVDTNVFALPSNQIQDVESALEAGPTVWVLPIYVNGKTVEITIGQGLPLNPDVIDQLSEEGIARIREQEGKWHIVSTACIDGTFNKLDIVKQEFGSVPEETILVGGLPNILTPVALIADPAGEISSLVPTNGDLPTAFTNQRARSANGSSKAYNYQQVKAAANNLQPMNQEGAGGAVGVQKNHLSYVTWAICFGVVGVICLGGYVVLKRSGR